MGTAGEKLDAEAAARVGRVLNEKWTLEKLLGIGGMGAVYLGRHRNGAKAAVKVLHSVLAKNPDVRDRFLREGYAANRVEHRGAVKVLDDDLVKDGDDEGAAYLVMELLEGESLEDRAARTPPLTEQEFLAVAEGVLDVLEAAHEHGVIHRDLKPDNIFLVHDPDEGRLRVKVLDFGLARLAERASTTQFGLAIGTPSYMSPEQASGQPDGVDSRTDLFALGATGFRLLARRRIHEEDNPVRLVLKMSTEPAPPIRSVAPQISETFAAIIDRALAFRPDDRYATAAAMRGAVQAALATMPPASLREPAPAVGHVSVRAPVEPTIAVSQSDLLPSSPDVLRELPRELSSEVSYTPAGLRPRSRIPHFAALFCGLLFFADRCLERPEGLPADEAMPVASSPQRLDAHDADTEAERDAEIEDPPDAGVAPASEDAEIADAVAGPDVADATPAPKPPVLPALPAAATPPKPPPKPTPRPTPPATTAKKPPPTPPRPPPKKPR